MKIYSDFSQQMKEDEKLYISNTIKAIEECLRRECKVKVWSHLINYLIILTQWVLFVTGK